MKLAYSLPIFFLPFVLVTSFSQAYGADTEAGELSFQGGGTHVFSPTFRAEKAALVDALFAPWSRQGMPGAAVLVVKDGQVLHRKGYGFANIKSKTPIGPSTSFLLGSTTKSFTALSVMMLADSEALNYGDSLLKFFPEFPSYARSITVRDLLHHTGGMAEYEDLFVCAGKVQDIRPRPITSKPEPYEPTARDALDLLSQQKKLQFLPGEEFRYSNSGYMVLAQIVEKVSKQRFRDFVKKKIFEPLGMTHSLLYDETKPIVQNRASSYSWTNGKYENVDYTPLNSIYGEDGIYSTLADMVQWVKAIDEKKLVKPRTWKQAFTSGQLNNGKYTGYGLGWFVASNYLWHDGAFLGFRAYIAHHPGDRFNVVILTNCKELNAPALGADVASIYLNDD